MSNSLLRRVRASVLLLTAVLLPPSFSGPAFAANGSVSYTYDALGRVLTASYDTGVIVIYTYDANGNRTQQTINVNSGVMCWNTTTGTCTSHTWDTGLWH